MNQLIILKIILIFNINVTDKYFAQLRVSLVRSSFVGVWFRLFSQSSSLNLIYFRNKDKQQSIKHYFLNAYSYLIILKPYCKAVFPNLFWFAAPLLTNDDI